MTVRVAAIAVVALAGVVRAQTCMWTESPTVLPRPQKRVGAAIAYDSVRQRVVLFGGFGLAGVPLGDTYEWTGTAWVLAATMGPSPRADARMAFHPGLNKTVLVGGWDGGTVFFGDTWIWEGTAWVHASGTGEQYEGGPVAFDNVNSRLLRLSYSGNQFRMKALNTATYAWEVISGPVLGASGLGPSYAMAFDSSRGAMVIYGGSTLSPLGNAWWEFSGAGSGSWVRRGVGPPGRMGAQMAYDSTRTRIVLFGGRGESFYSSPSEVFGDVWECDGTTWIERTEDGPGRRCGHCMVFDGARVFSFGGAGAYGVPVSQLDYHQDVWRYDGAQSRGVLIAQAPAAQSAFVGQVVEFAIVAPGAISFQWYRNGAVLDNGGEYSGVTTDTLTISGVTVVDRAVFSVQASAGCGAATARAALRVFDQFCFSNCDGSTVQPFLNINDFMCYLNRYAAGDLRANCDGSTAVPVLNAVDFQCFLSMYGAGCG